MSDFDSDSPPPRWLFLVLALVGLAVAGAIILAAFPSKGASAEPAPCMGAEMREQVRVLVLAGIDQALKQHAQRMFDVWQKDPTHQPKRAIAGMNSAINAYVGSRAAAQRWSPPACER
jgi:uncharacterized membrane protein